MFDDDAKGQLEVAALLLVGLSETAIADRLGRTLEAVQADAAAIRREWGSPRDMVRAGEVTKLDAVTAAAVQRRDSAETPRQRREWDTVLGELADRRAQLTGETRPESR